MLRYLSFAKKYQLNKGSYDPHELTKKLPRLKGDFSQLFVENKVMTLDTFNFTANNQGIISKVTDQAVTLININDDFRLTTSREFLYNQLVSLDLVNYSDEILTKYL